MTDQDLDEALAELEEARKAAQGELETLKHRRERIEQLERDKEALLVTTKVWHRRPWTRSRLKSATGSTSWCGSK